MNEIDFIFTNEQYAKLKQEYNNLLTPSTQSCISTLISIVNKLHINSFGLSLSIQNQIINKLSQALQILNILHTSNPPSKTNLINNPFSLIYNLANLSIQLNTHILKSPYQMLCLKANDLILQSIQQIANYFINKNIKHF
jgi:hypothetical protein